MVAFLGGLVVFLMLIIGGMWATIWEQRNQIAELREVRRSHAPRPWHVVVDERQTLPELWPAGDDGRPDEPTLASKV